MPKTYYMKPVLCQKLFAKCKIVQFDMKYVKGNDKKIFSSYPCTMMSAPYVPLSTNCHVEENCDKTV